jgi:hypothetical protein
MIEMCSAEGDKEVEALHADRFHPAFDEGILIWRARSRRLDSAMDRCKDIIEVADILTISVADEVLDFQIGFPSVFKNRMGLVDYPLSIGLECARRTENPSLVPTWMNARTKACLSPLGVQTILLKKST